MSSKELTSAEGEVPLTASSLPDAAFSAVLDPANDVGMSIGGVTSATVDVFKAIKGICGEGRTAVAVPHDPVRTKIFHFFAQHTNSTNMLIFRKLLWDA